MKINNYLYFPKIQEINRKSNTNKEDVINTCNVCKSKLCKICNPTGRNYDIKF